MDTVEIICNGVSKVTVLKSIVMENSEVLRSIIENYPENTPCRIATDFTYSNMVKVIKYMETKEVELISFVEGIEIYEIAQNAKIVGLQSVCRTYLIQTMDVYSVSNVYKTARKHGDLLLQYNCWKTFSSTMSVMVKNAFIFCDKETLYRIVSRPIYEDLSEIQLFDGLVAWAKLKISLLDTKNENKKVFGERIRKFMEPLLPNIRFLAMSLDELKQRVFPLCILTDNEAKSIESYFTNKNLTNYPKNFSWNNYQRKKETYTSLFLYRHRKSPSTRCEKKMIKVTQFTCEVQVKNDCFIVGISLPIKYTSAQEKTVFVNGYVDKEKSGVTTQQCYCDGHGKVNLSELIYLKSNSICRLLANVVDTEVMEHSDIIILEEADLFSPDKDQKKEDIFDNIYFDVKLYF
ncbi:uncharacterized protein [Centruroides vittatus]|uniref:uncharacterized protein n=1 Tax=Centruroides vittatus TaxID=120091 RepID=UPI00351012E4